MSDAELTSSIQPDHDAARPDGTFDPGTEPNPTEPTEPNPVDPTEPNPIDPSEPNPIAPEASGLAI